MSNAELRTITRDQLDEVLTKHALFLDDPGNPSGCKADLSRFDLSGVNLQRARFKDARFQGAYLLGARDAVELNVVDPRGHRPIAVKQEDGTWMVAAGCLWLSLSEGITHWRGRSHEFSARYIRAINDFAEEYGVVRQLMSAP